MSERPEHQVDLEAHQRRRHRSAGAAASWATATDAASVRDEQGDRHTKRIRMRLSRMTIGGSATGRPRGRPSCRRSEVGLERDQQADDDAEQRDAFDERRRESARPSGSCRRSRADAPCLRSRPRRSGRCRCPRRWRPDPRRCRRPASPTHPCTPGLNRGGGLQQGKNCHVSSPNIEIVNLRCSAPIDPAQGAARHRAPGLNEHHQAFAWLLLHAGEAWPPQTTTPHALQLDAVSRQAVEPSYASSNDAPPESAR